MLFEPLLPARSIFRLWSEHRAAASVAQRTKAHSGDKFCRYGKSPFPVMLASLTILMPGKMLEHPRLKRIHTPAVGKHCCMLDHDSILSFSKVSPACFFNGLVHVVFR
jgi:hypothetical protein